MKVFNLIIALTATATFSSCNKDETANDGINENTDLNITYKIVDTDTKEFYSDVAITTAPKVGDDFYGQDATYKGNQPSYTDNSDGTISDNVTSLMWAQEMDEKLAFSDVLAKASESSLGRYDDWRVSTLKELYTLILFYRITSWNEC